MQTISGTGAVHLGALFLAKFYVPGRDAAIYVSDPTWANHGQILGNVGLRVAKYPYFDKSTRGLDFSGMTAALGAGWCCSPPGSSSGPCPTSSASARASDG